MRISGQTLKELRPILTKALENETSVSFTYHEKKRNGPLTDFGFGPQGPFITINQNESYKSFSLLKISDFSVSKPVKETPVNDGFPSDVADFSEKLKTATTEYHYAQREARDNFWRGRNSR
jgi:hypothetical protein